MTNKSKFIFASSAIFLTAVLLTVTFFSYQLLKVPMSDDKTEIVFDVAPGATVAQISNDLQTKGLVRNSAVFLAYTRLKRLAPKIKVGEYSLSKAMSPDEILDVIVSGKSIARNLTVVEGLSLFDLAEIFEQLELADKQEFYNLTHDREFIKSLLNEDLPSLEGYLFPDTYKFTKFETTKSIVTQMVKRFINVWSELQPLTANSRWTRNQIVTFASIIEKETGASSERALVSSVFHNRLVKKMKLQTDPTVLYGKAIKEGHMPANITRLDLLTPTKYNSYTNYGLPPTPISNPGKESLLATLQPANTKYLYFVSRNDGTTVFSESLQQHNVAVKTYQLNPKARQGKSWKDLKKKNK